MSEDFSSGFSEKGEAKSPLVWWPLYLAAFLLLMATEQHHDKRIIQAAKQECASMIKHHFQEAQYQRGLKYD